MTLTPQTFPAEIRRIRRENNLSVKDLATLVGVSPRTIENWEQGHRIPRTGIGLINLFSQFPPT
jgi:DNA-binding transcriptional regulator YiaG